MVINLKTALLILCVIAGIIAIIVISIDASNKMKKEKFSQRMILNSNNVRLLKR